MKVVPSIIRKVEIKKEIPITERKTIMIIRKAIRYPFVHTILRKDTVLASAGKRLSTRETSKIASRTVLRAKEKKVEKEVRYTETNNEECPTKINNLLKRQIM